MLIIIFSGRNSHYTNDDVKQPSPFPFYGYAKNVQPVFRKSAAIMKLAMKLPSFLLQSFRSLFNCLSEIVGFALWLFRLFNAFFYGLADKVGS